MNEDGSHTSHDESGDQSADRTSLKENDGNSGSGDQSKEKQIENGDQAKGKGTLLSEVVVLSNVFGEITDCPSVDIIWVFYLE